MRLGLALGAGFQSALNTFGTVNDLADKMDERDADKRVRDALTSVPGVGSEYQDASGQTTRMTQPEYDRRRAEALGAGGRPRDVSASIQARTAVSQLTTAEMERARMGFVDSALRANALLHSGDQAGALRMMQEGYNRFMPDGVQATLRMDGNQVVGDRVGPNGQPLPPMRFENIQQASEMMLRFSSAPAYEAHLNRAVQVRGQDQNYAVGMAGVAATRAATASADRRHADGRELREEELIALRRRNAEAAQTSQRLNQFDELMRVPPNRRSPEQQRQALALASEIGIRDPSRLRALKVRDADGNEREVLVNPFEHIANSGISQQLISLRGRLEGATPEQRRQIIEPMRNEVERRSPGAWARDFEPAISDYSVAAPTARRTGEPAPRGLPAPAQSPWGQPTTTVPFEAYRQSSPPPPASGGAHPAPGLPRPAPQGVPSGAVPRPAIEEWLRNNPPPQAR